MKKEQKERWIAKKFIELYDKDKAINFLNLRRISLKKASGPDFTTKNEQGYKIGIEVTELMDYPSTVTGQQRVLEDRFIRLLKKKISKHKFKKFSFSLYHKEYPAKIELLEKFAQKVSAEIDKLNLQKVREKGSLLFYVEGQRFTIYLGEGHRKNKIVAFLYGKSGITEEDRKNYFDALRLSINQKQEKAKGYLKTQPNLLVIYDNTDFGIFITDTKKEISRFLGCIKAGEFKSIYILNGNFIFELI